MGSVRRAFSMLLLFGVLTGTRLADAAPKVFVTAGPLVSYVWGSPSAFAAGAEVALSARPADDTWDSLSGGVFAQAQAYAPGSNVQGRYVAGVHAEVLFAGVEVGYAYREPSQGFLGTSGLHLGLFSSVGYGSVALRTTVPLSASGPSGQLYGPELGLVFSLKLPFQVAGPRATLRAWGTENKVAPCWLWCEP